MPCGVNEVTSMPGLTSPFLRTAWAGRPNAAIGASTGGRETGKVNRHIHAVETGPSSLGRPMGYHGHRRRIRTNDAQ